MTEKQISKRELLKKAAYVAPAILTLKAVPSLATTGSGVTAREKGNNGVGNGIDGQPPGNPPSMMALAVVLAILETSSKTKTSVPNPLPSYPALSRGKRIDQERRNQFL